MNPCRKGSLSLWKRVSHQLERAPHDVSGVRWYCSSIRHHASYLCGNNTNESIVSHTTRLSPAAQLLPQGTTYSWKRNHSVINNTGSSVKHGQPSEHTASCSGSHRSLHNIHNIHNTSNHHLHSSPLTATNSINNNLNKSSSLSSSSKNNKFAHKNVIISTRNQSQSFLLEHVYGLCFLGAPGVGKGTYSTRIAKEFGAKVLSSGDLIRDCAKLNAGTALGDSLTRYINSGQLVPDDIVIPMVVDYLRLLPSTFILDGFPRTLHQAERIHNEYQLNCVMHFKLPDHILIQKMLGRRICTNCSANFNVAHIDEGEIHMPSMAPKVEGICDNCESPLSMREDDTEETIAARMKIFHEQTGPIERFYKQSGLLIEHNIKKGVDDLPEIVEKLRTFLQQYYPTGRLNVY